MNKLKTLSLSSGYTKCVIIFTSYVFLLDYKVISLVFLIASTLFLLLDKKFTALLLLFTICFLYNYKIHYNTTNLTNPTTLTGIIKTIPEMKNDKIKFTFETTNKELVIVNIPSDLVSATNLTSGQALTIKGNSYQPTSPTTPNIFDYKQYLYYQEIHWIFNVEEYLIIPKIAVQPSTITQKLYYYIDNIHPSYSSKYIKAFLFGNKVSLDEEILNSTESLGIMHLFVVSGLHINTILLLGHLFKPKWLPSKVATISTTIFLVTYTILLDFSPSIFRASLFYWYSKLLIPKGVSKLNILSLAFLTMTLINPFYIHQLGFLLSFVVTYVLILFIPAINSPSKIKNITLISIMANLATIPIISYTMYDLNYFAIINNIIVGTLIVTIFFPATLLVFLIQPLYRLYFYIVNIFEWLLLYASHLTPQKIIVGKFNIFLIALYYIVLLLAYVYIKNKKTKRGILLISALFLIPLINPYLNLNTEVTILDVGQGDSILVKSPSQSCNMLIDTGGSFENSISNYTTLPYLKSKGIRKLDYLVITHGDFDHLGEAINIINNLDVKTIIISQYSNSNKTIELLDVANTLNIKIVKLQSDSSFNCGKNTFKVLSPFNDFDNENNNSLVLHAKIGKYYWLFTGDIEEEVEKDFVLLYPKIKVDVLKVSHHGSKTSTSEVFVETYMPKYALISVGKNNFYGHPNDRVIERLKIINSKIYRTDLQGTIIFKDGPFTKNKFTTTSSN